MNQPSKTFFLQVHSSTRTKEIQFELSNSSSKSGRYPDDTDFKEALMISKKQNHSYGRAILLSIEEFETKNLPVDFDDYGINKCNECTAKPCKKANPARIPESSQKLFFAKQLFKLKNCDDVVIALSLRKSGN